MAVCSSGWPADTHRLQARLISRHRMRLHRAISDSQQPWSRESAKEYTHASRCWHCWRHSGCSTQSTSHADSTAHNDTHTTLHTLRNTRKSQRERTEKERHRSRLIRYTHSTHPHPQQTRRTETTLHDFTPSTTATQNALLQYQLRCFLLPLHTDTAEATPSLPPMSSTLSSTVTLTLIRSLSCRHFL